MNRPVATQGTNRFGLTDDEHARLIAGETITHCSGYKMTLDPYVVSDGVTTPVRAEPLVRPTWTAAEMTRMRIARNPNYALGYMHLREMRDEFGHDKYSAMMRYCADTPKRPVPRPAAPPPSPWPMYAGLTIVAAIAGCIVAMLVRGLVML